MLVKILMPLIELLAGCGAVIIVGTIIGFGKQGR